MTKDHTAIKDNSHSLKTTHAHITLNEQKGVFLLSKKQNTLSYSSSKKIAVWANGEA